MQRCNMGQGVPRKRWFLYLVAVSALFTTWLTYTRCSSARSAQEDRMAQKIAVLQTHLKFLKTQFDAKEENFFRIQATYEGRTESALRTDSRNISFSPALQALLRNISGSQAANAVLSLEKPDLIQTPFSLRIMPHLLENPDSLRPAYLLKSDRKVVDYIIGIPHVKRDKETYLFKTIKSLLHTLTEDDRNNTCMVVMIGETDLDYVISIAHDIEKQFPHELDAGLIEVISPDKSYYPDMDALPLTLDDSLKRVRWRTKQNLDAIFLMAYAQARCLYYLMLEDDVIAVDGYMKKIKQFTTFVSVSNPNWFFIEYSTTGGIGKLFRSMDLIHFINYVQLFYYNMPIDWLTESYLANRICGISQTTKQCGKNKGKIRPTYKQNLFKHVGAYSSLKGKYQKVKGYTTSTTDTYYPHSNPSLLKIVCDVKHSSSSNTIENAYNGSTYFWGVHPKIGDVIEFWFKTRTKIGRYVIRSGSYSHANDRIYGAVIEILPASNGNDGGEKDVVKFVEIATFDEFGMTEGNIEGKYGDLQSIRIRFTKDSKFWVIINEIEFEALTQDKKTTIKYERL